MDRIAQPRAKPSQLQQIVAGLSEGIILIDPDQTVRWANDAALKIHGVTSLDDLGSTVDDYRRRYTLKYRGNHRIKANRTPIERVVAGEAFHDVIVEVSRADQEDQQWVHDIRSLVITGPDDLPECLVLIVRDLTDEAQAEDRFESAFRANPAPAAICKLDDLRFVRVNDGFLEMTGYTREAVIGASAYEVDVLHRAERRDLAIERLREGRTIPQMEACLSVPADANKWVVVAGQPIEMPGSVPCMLFTFADLNARRRAENDLKESREILARSFQLMPVPAIRWTSDTNSVEGANDAFFSLFGYKADDLLADNTIAWDIWSNAAERKLFDTTVRDAGRVVRFDAQLRSNGGDPIYCLVSAEGIDNGMIIAALEDVTDRKRTEADLAVAIEAAMSDAASFSRKVMDKLTALRNPQQPTAPAGLDALTPREREILTLVADGVTDAAICKRLKVSQNTIRNHLASVYKKLGVNRRSAAVVFARQRGLARG